VEVCYGSALVAVGQTRTHLIRSERSTADPAIPIMRARADSTLVAVDQVRTFPNSCKRSLVPIIIVLVERLENRLLSDASRQRWRALPFPVGL